MPVVYCKSCGTRNRAPELAVGKKGRCSQCNAVMMIPECDDQEPIVQVDAPDQSIAPKQAFNQAFVTEARKNYRDGANSAKITSSTPAVVATLFYSAILVFAVFAPFPLWIRILTSFVCVILFGAMASSNAPKTRPENKVNDLRAAARAIVPSLLDFASGESNRFSVFATEHTENWSGDLGPSLTMEFIALQLHLLDRFAFFKFGNHGKEPFIDSVEFEMRRQLQLIGMDESKVFSVVQKRSNQLSQYKKLFANEGETPKGTLVWEFGRIISSEFVGGNPVVIIPTTKSAADACVFCDGIVDEIASKTKL